jgi:hypothetical protein
VLLAPIDFVALWQSRRGNGNGGIAPGGGLVGHA